MTTALLFPMAAHVAWTFLLYNLLTLARAPKIWGVGLKADGSNPWAALEPRISANLSNQFEWPLFFYISCVLLMQINAVGLYAVVLAWVFILGRIVHSLVQILTTNIRLRGLVFTINFLGAFGLWALLLVAGLALSTS